MERKTFYITTPIFYPNGELHMGHAYTVTLCDIVARYQRLLGKEVHFLTGSDEHTVKVVRAGEKVGKGPKEYIDGILENFRSLYSSIDISYDQFIRTSDKETHWPGAIALWNKLVEAGDIYKKKYAGLYCVGHEAFITEKDLVNGVCPDHGVAPENIEEENYFFKLSKYTDAVRTKIESGELTILPETRKNEILSLLKDGLQDVSFSRPVSKNSWAIPVPNDPEQVMYVWCDALANYITAIGYGRDEKGFNHFWPADYHVIGKDILRFHAAFWPAMLMSAGLPLPKKIMVHGMITSQGKKMSKTLGNVINPLDLLHKYGKDALRFFLAKEVSPFEDGDVTVETFEAAYNSALTNGLGNLTSRIMQMAISYEVTYDAKALGSVQHTILSEKHAAYRASFDSFRLNEAAGYVWKLIAELDAEIQTKEPFKLFKINPDEARVVVKGLVEKLWEISCLLAPILPDSSAKVQLAIVNKVKPTLFPRK